MIKINLIPYDQFVDKKWYIKALGYILFFSLLISLCTYFFIIKKKQISIDDTNNQIIIFRNKSLLLSNYSKNYKNLDLEIKILDRKILAIKKIDLSSLTKFSPIIVVEHLQNLKPEGIWFTNINVKGHLKRIELTGGSFDNILVSDFISNLKSTNRIDIKPESDLRSRVYFSRISLEKITKLSAKIKVTKDRQSMKIPSLSIPKKNLFAKVSDDMFEKDRGRSSGRSSFYKIFPELNEFYDFKISIDYKNE